MQLKNIFEQVPVKLEQEVFEILAQNNAVKIERIISKGHTSPAEGWYDQEQDEWVMLLQGEALIAFEDGTEVRLKAGDHINIAAHCKHRVKWTTAATETIWLAVFL